MSYVLPTKHTNPDQTAIYAATLMLKYLAKNRICNFNELKSFIEKNIEGGEFLFIPALSILFLLGKIKYHIKTDSIEFIDS
ncbi:MULTISPECIES: ABC-three component system middle component 8 [Acinetobacter]|uniref:Uncharacterized protein n=1 Tax=Acinetobacter shaoyimingii TaxID=2715164 RepID=A0A6G8RSY1_9GAMM|nr:MULTISPECIES: ABC-three component system middle component 8 [Acinetobacter]OAL77311.1 hypothetical protein AY606_11525 [Acinetobacter sp. SFB]QIO05014.1 hypothetical protein G8E00_03015 [Acinetobacter shaoyimingii]